MYGLTLILFWKKGKRMEEGKEEAPGITIGRAEHCFMWPLLKWVTCDLTFKVVPPKKKITTRKRTKKSWHFNTVIFHCELFTVMQRSIH